MHFTDHVTEAMVLNRRRAREYDRLSDGASRVLSAWLLAIESATLPIAGWFDAQPWAHHLQDAFVPMTGVFPFTQQSRYRSGGSVRAALHAVLLSLHVQATVLVPILLADWLTVQELAVQGLRDVWALEARQQVHFAMLGHFVESVVRAAWVAPRLPRPHHGRVLVGVQVASLPVAVFLDVLAWPAQARGVGVLVNDLPDCLPPQM